MLNFWIIDNFYLSLNIFPHHKIKCMICKKALVKVKCDGICKNESLLNTNIRYSYESKLKQNSKKLSYISHQQKCFSWKFIPWKIPLFKGYVHELVPFFGSPWGIKNNRLEWTKGGTTWKWNLAVFKYKNECYKQFNWKKSMKKNGVICPDFVFPSWVMVRKLS